MIGNAIDDDRQVSQKGLSLDLGDHKEAFNLCHLPLEGS